MLTEIFQMRNILFESCQFHDRAIDGFESDKLQNMKFQNRKKFQNYTINDFQQISSNGVINY